MVDSINGWATIGGAAKLLHSSYWSVYEAARQNKVSKIRLSGSKAVLVRVAEVAALVNKK